jgi:hypothetical protein
MIDELSGRFGRWAYALAVLLLVYNLLGTLQSALRFPPGVTTQFYEPAQVDHSEMEALMAFLDEQGEVTGYTNYWVSYPLAFLSEERLIFVPRLPYHPDFRYTPRDDRYEPYGEIVEGAVRAAYITTNHPALNDRLRESFSALGVEWQETQIGAYTVFYDLSKLVRPEQIDLSEK